MGIIVREKIKLDKAKLITIEIKKVWEQTGVNIKAAQERQKRYINTSRQKVEDIEEKDKV